MEKYGVVFYRDEEYDGYVAEAIGLPGCVSQGKTMEEAVKNIKDAITGYVFVEKKHGRLKGRRRPAQYFLGEVSVGHSS
ncbi:MAG: type II toxin-antitoxin system HicB family antitoxin [Candidatus Aminicenantes bacterium]|nr:type II toxin-antitoxin system HicB family antitoxin [Candidatus Aminicenantes bacterium]